MGLIKHKSATVSDVDRNSSKRDRRVLRTRKQLDAAFVDLLFRRSYGNIRVSDITRKAGVGRATFYAHHASKDDLLMSQFRRIVAPMLVAKPHDACPLDAIAFFAHVTGSPRIYKALMGPEAGKAPRILRECIEQRVRQSLGDGDVQPSGVSADIRNTIVSRFVATSLLAVVECSIEGKACESPQSLQLTFSKLVGGGLSLFGDAKSNSTQKPL
jgi:AcrR family transcriptional regulator